MRPDPARSPAARPRYTVDDSAALFGSGATSLALFAGLRIFRHARARSHRISRNISTQILNARVDPGVSPYATVSMFQTKEDKVTVLWVDGFNRCLPNTPPSK